MEGVSPVAASFPRVQTRVRLASQTTVLVTQTGWQWSQMKRHNKQSIPTTLTLMFFNKIVVGMATFN